MQEKWADAIDLQLRVKEGREKVLGPYHEDTILVGSILAEIYTELGELEEAEAAVLATKTGDEKRLGVVQEPTIRAARDLGILYLKLGLYQRAEGFLTTVKAMYEERFGLEHEETLGAMSNIAKVYQCQNWFEEAEKELLKSKEYMERVLGQDHKYTKITTNNLVQMYLEQGRIQEAMTIFLPKDQHCSANSVSLQQGCEDVDSEEMLKAAIKMTLQPDSDLSEEDQDDMLELERAIELSFRNDDDWWVIPLFWSIPGIISFRLTVNCLDDNFEFNPAFENDVFWLRVDLGDVGSYG
jgi:tetratricopeptide (TPR) repeat protein